MPELPEVEIIRRSLEQRLMNRRIMDTEILLSRQIKWPDIGNFVALVAGRTFVKFERRGKYLLFSFDNGNMLVFHLRMTGRLCYMEANTLPDPYARIIFHLAGGDALVYADTRTLGALYALRPGELWRLHGLSEMGLEPLSAEFTPAYLQQVLQGRKTRIKSFLLNQKYIGGLGNIYADETLFLAKIHPLRLAGSLSMPEIVRLHEAANAVIQAGITDGGTTFRDYRDGNGHKGHHQESLQVYHRTGKACTRCGTCIERIVVGGRSTHFCPQCQPLLPERCNRKT